MLRSFFLYLLLAVCNAVCQTSGMADYEKVVNDAHAKGDFDGVVVISQGGKVAFTSAVGFADIAAKIPNRPDTVFLLASLTKQVTALLIVQEVTAGHITLDQPAGKILPKLPPSSSRVTVRQLLQHVSGLPNPSDGPENSVPEFYRRTGASASDMTATALGFCSAQLKRTPGTQFEYNNCDYIILGALLEQLGGKTYAQLVQERIIGPLALKSWGLFPADPKLAPKMAKGRQADGSPDAYQNPATYGSAGALYGNALDVAKWNESLLTNRLLDPNATATMFQPNPKLYGEALSSWVYDLPLSTSPLHIIERQGDIGSIRLLSLLVPAKNASVVIIANTERADLFNTYSKKGLGYALLLAMSANP